MKNYAIDRTKHLSVKEYDNLHARLTAAATTRPRDATLLFTSLYTGARPQEILNLRPKDLDHEQGTVFIRGLKGSDNRELPLPVWLFESLAGLAADKSAASKIFGIGYQRYVQIWKRLGIPGHSLKSLRHTFAVRHYKQTNNLMLIQTALGHRSIQNTIVYAKYHMTQTQMRELLLPAS